MNKLLLILLFAAQASFAQPKGTIKMDTLASNVLGGSVTKEDTRRPLAIYLPPGYFSTSKRYPVLYLLHGIGDDHMNFVDDTTRYANIQDLMDAGIASHRFGEMIIVTPNEKTNWFGSFYTNSSATGKWEDFTATELVNYMDAAYRTIAKASARAIAGHSMGGYGAITLAMKHPEVFSIAYALSGGFICFGGEIKGTNPDVKKFVQAKTLDELLATQSRNAIGLLTVAQAFSPNANKPPLYADKPFKMQGTNVIAEPGAYKKWVDKDVVNMAEKYKENLLQLKAIRFDAGDEDEYKFIPMNSRLFSKKLTALHIPHQFEEYNGDHRNRLWGLHGRIYNDVLTFVYDNIVK